MDGRPNKGRRTEMPKDTIHDIQNSLDSLKDQYRKRKNDYRRWRYEALASAMKIVVELRKGGDFPAKLRRLQKRLVKSGSRSSSLTAAVLAYITGGRSENAFKIAWKWARVIEFLHDHKKVKIARLAKEIGLGGGIESLAREAAKENPRRNTRSTKSDRERRSQPSSRDIRFRIESRTAVRLKSIKSGTKVRLFGIRTSVRGLTPGAIIEVRKFKAFDSEA